MSRPPPSGQAQPGPARPPDVVSDALKKLDSVLESGELLLKATSSTLTTPSSTLEFLMHLDQRAGSTVSAMKSFDDSVATLRHTFHIGSDSSTKQDQLVRAVGNSAQATVQRADRIQTQAGRYVRELGGTSTTGRPAKRRMTANSLGGTVGAIKTAGDELRELLKEDDFADLNPEDVEMRE